MTLGPGLRKFALTVHVIASVGWIGAVAGFLALAVAGLMSPEVELVRASYVAMDVVYRTVIIPLGLASLITGFISSLGTDWGLFRYYWILVKLLLTAPATWLMVEHLKPVRYAAHAVSAAALADTDLGLRRQLIVFAIAALAFLLTATVLSTYKPRGRTRYGWHKLARAKRVSASVEHLS